MRAPHPANAGERAGRSPWRVAWTRFRRDRTGVVSGVVVLVFVVVGLGAPVIAWLYGKNPYETYGQNTPGLLNEYGFPIKPNGGIDGEFWLGLEPSLGRDVFTQLLYGIRTSLLIAMAVVVIVTVVGVVVGIVAGYFGGFTDFAIGRIIDVLLAFPGLLFFITIMPVVTALFVSADEETPVALRVAALIVVLCFFGWTRTARLLRGQVLSLREREFVEAARVSGAKPWRIIHHELLPNLWTPILVTVTLDLPAYVTVEAALSFLGVGIVEPTPDWGRMIHRGAEVYVADFTYMAIPGLAMLIFVLAFNLLGDSARDALDPRTSR
ncbi:ABC transporter permease [Microtetraspora sp. AC03309]|uniref:ABC transporter permease n=1 Tax=Microtetraspora sp. AC03309 TaxID=2779376 RepID=UPI001E45A433|nr:ABC transporter permease [Microtetraspora sp. AC03309]MCC5576386.1 ABC transporter permease [Microtetraspora sp. AC03309]